MHYRPLGNTGLQISAIALGAGPVSTLMTGTDTDRQRAVVARALDAGINWFDTAASYGQGQSERSLGQALAELQALDRVHLATKVRLLPDDLTDLPAAIERSVLGSLERLRCRRLTLLQLHNSITPHRDDEPTSLTPADVLDRRGIADIFRKLQEAGLVQHLGLTGIGHPESLRTVIRSGLFQTIQVPYHLLNPSAGQGMPDDFPETDYGNIIGTGADHGMGVMAIRVLAGGALADQPPSPHTLKTPFFPLALYERDRERARTWLQEHSISEPLPVAAIRFALAHPQIHSAIIGFQDPQQVEQAARVASGFSWTPGGFVGPERP